MKVMVMGPWKWTAKQEVNKHVQNHHFLNNDLTSYNICTITVHGVCTCVRMCTYGSVVHVICSTDGAEGERGRLADCREEQRGREGGEGEGRERESISIERDTWGVYLLSLYDVGCLFS